MAYSPKPLVLVVGATGQTGKSIVDGLLKSNNFVRPYPSTTPAV